MYDVQLEKIKKSSIADQVSYWSDLLVDFLLDRNTEEVEKMKSMYRSKYDAEDELIKLGHHASDHMVTLFEIFSGYRPLPDGSHVESDSHTRWTFLSILIDIKSAEQRKIHRLQQVLTRKYEVDNQLQECINMARTLHELDPTRFPEEEHDERRHTLINYQDYK
ncbi:hypothetical protein D3C76_1142040 [compost metagenome]